MAEWQRRHEAEEAEARRKAEEKTEREERERIAAEEKARRERLLNHKKFPKAGNACLTTESVKPASSADSQPKLISTRQCGHERRIIHGNAGPR